MGMTKQRQKILEIVKDRAEHLTAEQIYALAKETVHNIGIGTVYRNLNILADSGIIKRVNIPSEPVRFDRTLTPHDHLVCLKCGKILDIPKVSLELPPELKQSDIRILQHTLTIHCICADCLKEFRYKP